jgi:hypothetical protein
VREKDHAVRVAPEGRDEVGELIESSTRRTRSSRLALSSQAELTIGGFGAW